MRHSLICFISLIATANAFAQGYSPYPNGGSGTNTTPSVSQASQPIATQGATVASEGDRKKAFEAIRQTASPLTPEQIRELSIIIDATDRAKAQARPQPKPVIGSITVDSSPGATPPIIRLSDGHETTIVFLDGHGVPWPIRAWRNGDERAFLVVNPLAETAQGGAGSSMARSNMLNIGLKDEKYSSGSLAVFLQDASSPITFTLTSRQREVDYRVDIRVLGRSPLATPAVIAGTGDNGVIPELVDVLAQLPPKGAHIIPTQNKEVQVWEYNGVYLVRTPFRMISPAWNGQQMSADGMMAYRIPPTPLIIASREGKLVQIVIGEGIQ